MGSWFLFPQKGAGGREVTLVILKTSSTPPSTKGGVLFSFLALVQENIFESRSVNAITAQIIKPGM